MSLFGNLKDTLSDVAGSMIDQSKALSQTAQLQMNLKKLQIERAKRVHELGKKTYDWYRGGNLVVSGPVPPDVGQLCHEIDDLDRQHNEAENQIQAIQEAQAAQAAQQAAGASPPAQPAAPAPPAPPPGALTPPHAQPGATPPVFNPNSNYNPDANSGYNPNPNQGYNPPPNPGYNPNSNYGTSILPNDDAPGTPPPPPSPPGGAPGTDAGHPWGPPPGS